MFGDQGGVEEPHLPQVRHHATMAFAKHGDEQGVPAGGGVAVENLAAEDGLPYAGRPLDHIEAATQETTV